MHMTYEQRKYHRPPRTPQAHAVSPVHLCGPVSRPLTARGMSRIYASCPYVAKGGYLRPSPVVAVLVFSTLVCLNVHLAHIGKYVAQRHCLRMDEYMLRFSFGAMGDCSTYLAHNERPMQACEPWLLIPQPPSSAPFLETLLPLSRVPLQRS